MAGAEGFTILAILEARDAASEIFAKVDESLAKFSESAASAADTARAAGETIDESLLSTASGADALDLASARVAAAQARAAQATDELINSERALLEAQEAAADATGDGVAEATALADADTRLAAAQRGAAAAASALADAQKLQSDTAAAAAAKNDEAAAGQDAVTDASDASAVSLASVGKVAGITAIGLGIVGGLAVKAAGNFQSLTQHLVTDAGESQSNLAMIRSGILSISSATATSADDIYDAMYHIESGGFHAQTALDMAKVAAEGAKVGGADLDTVSKALVGTMNAYYGSTTTAANATQRSTSMMEELIATVGSGDMKMQDLASSLSNVAPLAAAAGISFAQVGGAVATMTSQGMSAQQATQDLNNVIRNMVKPSATASNEMRALGLNANQISEQIGSKGLTGTLDEYTEAILKNTSGGMVSLGYYKQMSPAAKSLANQISAGTISTEGLRQAVYNLNPEQAKLVSLFDTASTSATGLKQTYTGAMSALTGGATGLNVAMMLTGKNAKTFSDNVANITKQGKGAATLTSAWAKIQSTFNYKVEGAVTALKDTGIAIGSALLPAATRLMAIVAKVGEVVAVWTAKHQKLTEILFVSVTGLTALVAAISLATKAFKAVSGAVSSVRSVISGVIGLFKKLGGAAKASAAEQQKAATDAADTQKAQAEESAAVQEEASGEAAAAQEADAGEVAAANDTAAAESSGSWLAAAASTLASWAATAAGMVAQAAVWVATNTAKVAVVVATNVAGALSSAASWIAANALMTAGIVLVVAAVALAVVEIVKHWSDIVHGAEVAWNAVYDFTSKIIGDVISFVKSHWVEIIAIFLGPIAIVAALVATHWKLVEGYFKDGVKAVEKALSWFTGLSALFRRWLGDAASAVASAGEQVLGWFEQLPGRIISFLSGLSADMRGIGLDIVHGLWNGISGAASYLIGQVKNLAGDVLHGFESAFGIGSPSKYTTVHGLMLGAGIAGGILQSIPQAVAAARKMSDSVLAATSTLSARSGSAEIGSALAASAVGSAAGSAGGGGTQIVVNVTGNTIMSDSDADKLAQKIGRRLSTVTLPAAGRKIRLS